MTNYQEGQDPLAQGGAASQGAAAPFAGTPQPSGAGYGAQPGRGDRFGLKNSLRSTEFWVLVLVSLALLIAAAVSDQDGGHGFGAQDAWRYVTALSAAYILSRGLAKFGGRDEESDDHHRHR